MACRCRRRITDCVTKEMRKEGIEEGRGASEDVEEESRKT
jgi:hypothetical protein